MSFGFGFGFPRRAAAGGAAPSLNFDFTSLTSLPSRITFSRTSNATLTNSNGRVAYAPHNLLTNSEDFEASAWTKSNVTISANSAVAPDGTTTADKFIADAVNTLHYIQLSVTAISNIAVGTIYVKLDGSNVNKVTIYPGGSATFALFDLQTLTATREANCLASSITPLNDGWYRLTAAWPASAATDRLRFYAGSGASGDAPYAGNGVNGIFIWGAQLNVANAPVNLLTWSEQFDNAVWGKTGINTTGAPAWVNVTTAPDGTLTADKLIANLNNTDHVVSQATISITSGSAYTLSAFFKGDASNQWVQLGGSSGAFGANVWANFDVLNGVVGFVGSSTTATIEPASNGFFRCAVTGTATASTTGGLNIFLLNNTNTNARSPAFVGSNTNGVSAWGAQLNTGSTALPYVATTSSIYLPPSYNSTTPKNLLGFTQEFDNAAWTKSNSFVQTNLLTWSEQFDNGVWGKSGAAVTANTSTAPDGILTADTLTANSGTASLGHGIFFDSTFDNRTFSIYVKAGTTPYIQVCSDSSTVRYVNFDITAGAGAVGTAGFQFVNAAITNAGNNWYRCSFQTNYTAASERFRIIIVSSASAPWRDTFSAAIGTETVFLWGAQLVQGSVPGDYQVTTSAAAAVQYSDPNGTRTADKLVENTTLNFHFTAPASSIATVSGTPSTLSVYMKAGERRYGGIHHQDGTAKGCSVDLLTGTLGTPYGGATAQLSSLGSGWYRLSVTATLVGANTPAIYVSDSNSLVSYTGDGTSGIYIWGAQLSNSASVDPYVYNPQAAPTSTAYYGPRFDYNPTTLAANGLLIEEQRTNLVLRSEDFSTTWSAFPSGVTVTTNTFIAPDGTLTADTLIADGTVAGQLIQQSITFTGDGTKCISIFLKAGTAAASAFDVRDTTAGVTRMRSLISWAAGVPTLTSDIGTTVLNTATPMGNDWYRVLVAGSGIVAANNHLIRVYPAGASVTPVSGTTIAWGAQAENGAFPTSYIPTQASQVTRAADNASMLGDNFATWYRQDQGTIFVQWSQISITSPNNQWAFTVTDGTTNNYVGSLSNPNNFRALVVVGGATQSSIINGAVTANTPIKTVNAYQANNFAATSGGAAVLTDTSGTVPTVTQAWIGSINSSTYLNGHIRAISYYPTALPPATLQAITQ
jgi:hypothetical protein